MIRFIPGKEYNAFTYVSVGTPRDIVTEAKVRIPEVFPGLSHEYVETRALWDTGATDSVITKELAARLGLPPIGRAQTVGIHGPQTVDVFSVDILLMDRVSFLRWRVSSGSTGPTSPGLIIGMDIIAKGDFALSKRRGGLVFSFVIPSSETAVDYVEAVNAHNTDAFRIHHKPSVPGSVAPPKRRGRKRKR